MAHSRRFEHFRRGCYNWPEWLLFYYIITTFLISWPANFLFQIEGDGSYNILKTSYKTQLSTTDKLAECNRNRRTLWNFIIQIKSYVQLDKTTAETYERLQTSNRLTCMNRTSVLFDGSSGSWTVERWEMTRSVARRTASRHQSKLRTIAIFWMKTIVYLLIHSAYNLELVWQLHKDLFLKIWTCAKIVPTSLKDEKKKRKTRWSYQKDGWAHYLQSKSTWAFGDPMTKSWFTVITQRTRDSIQLKHLFRYKGGQSKSTEKLMMILFFDSKISFYSHVCLDSTTW